ncbi:HNH endonuclease [Clostridium sp.]|uniref:HNH endonuclease n=1 Tax=Clostridium sp. TaxID=1506 RepID=UPI003F3477D6
MSKPNIKCEVCGKEFYKKPFRIEKEKNHCCGFECQSILRHSFKVKPIEDKFGMNIKDLLHDLYIVKMYPTGRIGKEIGLSKSKVCEWLKKYDISIRYGSEAIKTQWIDADERRAMSSMTMKDNQSRGIDRSFMHTDEYKLKQSISKRGSKNGMWRVCGEKHPNWDKNRTHEKRKLERKSTKDNMWRSSVFYRDNRTCFKCSENNIKNMVVHHIDSYDIHEDKRYDINNGIVLCEKCHKDFHGKYGYGKNTRTQFEEWIKAD